MTDKDAYDSAIDTLDHIDRVQDLMTYVVEELSFRASVHDASKLQSPEKEIFDRETPNLKVLTYGSDEYKESLSRMKVALDHHYANNRHHPEYHSLGISGMNLIDLIEMLVDWKAATERHEDGDIRKSIDLNAERFHYSAQIASIFHNTITDMGWERRGHDR